MSEYISPYHKITGASKLKIIELWNQGLTGQAIGDILGVSRCSVLGFINRLRCKGHVFDRPIQRSRLKKENVVKKIVEQLKKENVVIKSKKNEIQTVIKPKTVKQIIKKEPVKEACQSVDIIGLKPYSCRYPVSADDVFPVMFCGKRQEHGSYCKEHGAICYYPSKHQMANLPD